jgi:hypothetical protein
MLASPTSTKSGASPLIIQHPATRPPSEIVHKAHLPTPKAEMKTIDNGDAIDHINALFSSDAE